MITDHELDGLVHDWVRDGGSALSDRVFAGVLAGLPTTAQRRGFRPIGRWRALPAPTRFALVSSAAVVVIVAAGVGLLLAGPGPNVGPIVPTSPVSPNPSTSPSSSAPAPSAATHGVIVDKIDGLRIAFDLPFGWESFGIASAGPRVPGPRTAEVTFYDIAAVNVDPCAQQLFVMRDKLGPTVADLVAAFQDTKGYDLSGVQDVAVGGYSGKQLRLTAPPDADQCPSGFALFGAIGSFGFARSDQRDDLRVVNVDGIRLVVDAVSFPNTSGDDLAAQQELIKSIRIERVHTPLHPMPQSNGRGTVEGLDGLRIAFDLPSGWRQSGTEVRFGDRGIEAGVSFYDDVDIVWQNPCRRPSLATNSRTGTTAALLAAKFQTAQGYSASPTLDVTLSGYRGNHLTLQMPETYAGCDRPGALILWTGSPADGVGNPGERHGLWILDVDGLRLMIDAWSSAGTSAEVLAVQQQVIDSISNRAAGHRGPPDADARARGDRRCDRRSGDHLRATQGVGVWADDSGTNPDGPDRADRRDVRDRGPRPALSLHDADFWLRTWAGHNSRPARHGIRPRD